MKSFLAELKRRNVYKVAAGYLVVGWLILQVASTILPAFHAPEGLFQGFVIVVALGFPVALVIAWAFEMTPEGMKRTDDVPPNEYIPQWSRQKFAVFLASASLLAAGLLAYQLIRGRIGQSAANAESATAPEKSIAVLPFENLSDEKENAYFAEGVQDEILTDLAKVADLKVISRTSVSQYQAAAARNLREIARQLGVAHVLEGSVQRANQRVRINAQLIDARNDAHLWAQTYDRELKDVFAIQSEIAQTIAEQLQAHLSPKERAAIAQPPTTDLAAKELYVRAQLLDDLSNDPAAKEGLLQGISLLEEAVRRDPNYLAAYCLLSEINLDLYWGGFDHTAARRDQARVALEEAERINPDAGEVHLQKGIYAYHGFRDYDQALSEFEIARRQLPNSARLYLYLASVDRRRGLWDDALKDFRRAVELDPRNSYICEETGLTYLGLRRYPEAASFLERARTLNPQDVFVQAVLALIPRNRDADLATTRIRLDEIYARGKELAAHVAAVFIDCALAERNRDAANQALTLIPADGTVGPVDNSLWPREWFVGLVARSFGDNDGAERAFSAARVIAAKTTEQQPDYAPAWAILGAIDAGLGRKTDAIPEGKRACELLSLSKDAWEGPAYVLNLARIYVWLGEKDLALEQLAISTKNPAGVSYGEMKLSSVWDPLRSDPRFERIVASLAPKQDAR
jgi:TolB-like protein